MRDLERRLEVEASAAVEALLRNAGLERGDCLFMRLNVGPSTTQQMRVGWDGDVSPTCGGCIVWDATLLGSFLEQVDEALAEWNRQREIRMREAETMAALITKIQDKTRYLNDPKMVGNHQRRLPGQGRTITLLTSS